ncbi:MAG TPA: hypothetical protein VL096_09645 [Pirellulaceae bacterium]|nr:hypothetical protein [Pirellulaceae bacterium]
MRWLILSIVLLAPTAAQAADYPPYLVLRAPATPKNKHETHGYYPGRGYAVETNAYNYGWFGAKYGATWSRSFGTTRHYTQWKKE